MNVHTIIRAYYRGVGLTLEQDAHGAWWSTALGHHEGPHTTQEQALAYLQDWIDSRE